jgi:hypothetical protein
MTTREAILILRNDAMERGLDGLALLYGWSAVMLGAEVMFEQRIKLEQYRRAQYPKSGEI